MMKDRHSNGTEVVYRSILKSIIQWRACKHLIEFMGIKQQAEKFGLGSFDLKLFRLEKIDGKAENFAIVTKAQLNMELPFLMGSTTSELNGGYFVSSFCLEFCPHTHAGCQTTLYHSFPRSVSD